METEMWREQGDGAVRVVIGVPAGLGEKWGTSLDMECLG